MELERVFDEFTARDWQTRESGTVRFAMVGLGWWVLDRAIPAVAQSDLCETTVAVSGSAEKAARVASEHDLEAGVTYDAFMDGAATEHYDAIYVCTPNALHLPYVETAAAFDKAVLCEKPMEATVERAEQMVTIVEDNDVPLMVAYRMQSDPAIRFTRRLVREGFIGEPAFVHGSMSQRLLQIIEDPNQWRLNPDLAGPGTSVTDLGIYPINTSRFVLDADPISAQAVDHSSDRDAFARVPDERAAFTLEFPDGVYVTCTASQNAHRTGIFRVTGLDGQIELDPAFFGREARAVTLSRGDAVSRFTFDPIDQMEEEFDHFATEFLEGDGFHADARHGLVDMRAIEAVYDAAERGETVSLT